ncbi:unnamed protein product [Mytilus coruscus]|uniref:Uncharacterized protein n=1 Tax=Mytilus coruscus TaxID=42192 RepID=A0A6J8BAX1_MYTCO|nr:unnamed protein product [Mytilus coruscus]
MWNGDMDYQTCYYKFLLYPNYTFDNIELSSLQLLLRQKLLSPMSKLSRSLNELNIVGMREKEIDVLEKRVDNLQKEKTESNMCLADIYASYQENHLDSNLSAAKVDSDTVEIKQSEQLCDTPELAYRTLSTFHVLDVVAEESKEVIKNLHINTNDVLRKIGNQNSKDEKEPIDLWLRNNVQKEFQKMKIIYSFIN